MSRIADRGLRNADSGMQIDAPLQPADRAVGSSTDAAVAPSNDAAALRNRQSAIGNRQSVELHIEELVLHGFAPGDRYSIGDAVKQELARSLAEQGVPSSLMQDIEIARLDGGEFQIAPSSKAKSIGNHVARSIYGGLNK